MIATNTKRPRNLDSPRAAAILYGDWGTSKAYVIGLAFAGAQYGSFWLIAAMCVLTALVGINYMIICRHYPDGGGVYASVRHRSEIISIVGAFLLIADYIVTAAISALSAFQYLGNMSPKFQLPHIAAFAAGAIVIIGLLNIFGPKHTGGLAFLVSVPTAIVVVTLGLFCIPHLQAAAHAVQPMSGGFWKNWQSFVAVVLALSGVEAIANATGVMKLNPGTTDAKPNVSKTSTPAILWVMLEVCIFTALLALGMHALQGLTLNNGDVDAPGHAGVRDYMLAYMAEIFVGGSWGLAAGHVASIIVSLVFALLLLSAVNTAIVDLIAISFLMSRDGELPAGFQKLNKFGVPNLGIIVATVVPAILVLSVSDMDALADLYAVGVVGAIATNLGASSTDGKLDLKNWERVLMFCTFLVMFFIEVSLFWTKPNARVFAGAVLLIGLIMRGLAAEHATRKRKALEAKGVSGKPDPNIITQVPSTGDTQVVAAEHPVVFDPDVMSNMPLICAVRGLGKTLNFALEMAKETRRPLYVLFVRGLPALTESDHHRKWQEDEEASGVFAEAKKQAAGHPVFPCYAVSDSVPDTIADITATVGANSLILGAPERNSLVHLLRGSIIREISDSLPEDIHLLVYA
jgi:amino acid transporter/nucleotide-binding universal stress UspA family protein